MLEMGFIKKVLKQSSLEGYSLLKEMKDKQAVTEIKHSEFGKKIYNELKDYISSNEIKNSPDITYGMYKEFETTGDRSIFEKSYFGRRKQLFSLIMAFMLEGERKYIPDIQQKLWEWCDLYSWELPAHFSMNTEIKIPPDKTVALFAAESAFFFAEILYCIGEELDSFLVKRLKGEILRRVIEPYEKNSYWWENSEMNWCSVCAGSVGAAAIYIIDDEERLALILSRVINSMECFIEGFDSKGVTAEGLYYWSYGFSFFVYFSELLKERTNDRICLLKENIKIKSISELPQILQFPSEDFVNFSDSGAGKWSGDCGLFKILEKKLKIEGYNYSNSYSIYFDATYRWAVMFRRLLWSSSIQKRNCEYLKTGNYYFEDKSWVVDRRYVEGKFIAFATKGGNNDEPHNHNDLGHFIVHYQGENLFIDIGSQKYEKEYFMNEKRYRYIATSSRGHSVPVVNGKTQEFGEKFQAKVSSIDERDDKVQIELDMRKAYPNKELEQLKRVFNWDYKKASLKLEDKFIFSTNKNNIEESFITKIMPEIIDDCNLKFIQNSICVHMNFDKPIAYKIEKIEYEDIKLETQAIFRTSLQYSGNNTLSLTFNIKIESY